MEVRERQGRRDVQVLFIRPCAQKQLTIRDAFWHSSVVIHTSCMCCWGGGGIAAMPSSRGDGREWHLWHIC